MNLTTNATINLRLSFDDRGDIAVVAIITNTKIMQTMLIENTWLTGLNHGWGNGYVVIPKGHPLFKMEYDEIDEEVNIRIHGGLTFSGPMKGHDWVIGFDTAHLGDTQEKWTKEAVQKETDFLLQQILDYTASLLNLD